MGQVMINPDTKEMLTYNDEYSFKDFTNRDLLSASDLSGETIYASCFSQSDLDRVVFLSEMTGVTFYRCNLDNCVIPDGNTTIDCSQRRIQTQPDGTDWLVDADNNLLESL